MESNYMETFNINLTVLIMIINYVNQVLETESQKN